MNRLALLTALLSLTTVPVQAAALRGAAQGNTVHVTSDIVTVGDLFDDAGAAAQMEVARAPAPGKTIALDSGTLYGIAVTNHIAWEPAGLNQRVIVMRDGDTVSGTPASSVATFAAVTAPLTPALAAKGAGDKLAILLDTGEQQHVLSALPAGAVLAVDTLEFDAGTRRFTARLTDAANGQRYAVSGRAIQMIKVPVPTRRIAEGDTIRPEDIDYVDQRADQLRSDAVLKPALLTGKVAKRQLEASQPVQLRFLGQPIIIKRGDRVTMVVRNGGIFLTADGRAEADAGLGEIVRLTNSATNKQLEGIATGPGTAEIRTDATIVAASASPATTVTR